MANGRWWELGGRMWVAGLIWQSNNINRGKDDTQEDPRSRLEHYEPGTNNNIKAGAKRLLDWAFMSFYHESFKSWTMNDGIFSCYLIERFYQARYSSVFRIILKENNNNNKTYKWRFVDNKVKMWK